MEKAMQSARAYISAGITIIIVKPTCQTVKKNRCSIPYFLVFFEGKRAPGIVVIARIWYNICVKAVIMADLDDKSPQNAIFSYDEKIFACTMNMYRAVTLSQP